MFQVEDPACAKALRWEGAHFFEDRPEGSMAGVQGEGESSWTWGLGRRQGPGA